MKTKIFLLLVFVFASFNIRAQVVDTTYYVDYDTYEDFDFSFGLPSAEISRVMNKNVFSMGANLSFYAKKHWTYGLYGQRLGSEINCPLTVNDTVSYNSLRLGYGHIGLEGGYVFFPEKKIHIIVGVRAGWGQISFSDDRTHVNANNTKYEYTKKIETHQFLVASPFFSVNYAFSPNFKLAITSGYRKNIGFENRSYTEKDFDGAFVALSILFGRFSFPKFE